MYNIIRTLCERYAITIPLYCMNPGFHVLARQGQGCWEMYKCYTIIQTSLDIDALLSRQTGIHPYQHVKMGFYDGWFHCVPNTLRPRRNWRHFADDILKWIFLNENVWIPIEISLKFVPQCPINNIPALVQIMAWRRPGDKPLSGQMMVRLPTHICVTRPQWVKDKVIMSDVRPAE